MKGSSIDAPDHLLYGFIDFGIIHFARVWEYVTRVKNRTDFTKIRMMRDRSQMEG